MNDTIDYEDHPTFSSLRREATNIKVLCHEHMDTINADTLQRLRKSAKAVLKLADEIEQLPKGKTKMALYEIKVLLKNHLLAQQRRILNEVAVQIITEDIGWEKMEEAVIHAELLAKKMDKTLEAILTEGETK